MISIFVFSSLCWSFGYFSLSYLWVVLLVLVAYYTNYKISISERLRKNFSRLAKNEKLLLDYPNLPNWVNFPDVERAEWLNNIISKVWFNAETFMEQMFRNNLEKKINASLPNLLKPFYFDDINFGTMKPRVDGIKMYTKNINSNQIMMDVAFNYHTDVLIQMYVRNILIGIQNFQIQGIIRIILYPLINNPPFIDNVSFFFINEPNINFTLTNTAHLLNVAIIKNIIDKIVSDKLKSTLVMPNQLVIPLSKNSNKTRNRLLNPQGLIKIEIKHAKNLKAADFNLFGDDTSDAYCVINVSNHQFKTKVIPETCNPVWNEEFLAIIYQFQGQALQIECFDKDYNSDDKLGECFIRLEKLVNEITERYYRLEFGKIYMKTSWLTYSENLEISDDSIEQLAVYVKIHSAQDLPRTKQNMHEPSTLVITSMGQVNHETGIQKHNCFPKWNECFYFYTNNLTHEYLTFTIRTKKEILYTSREELIAFKNSNGAKKQIVLIRKDYKSTLAVTVKIMNFSSIDKVIVEEKEIKQESEENRSQIDIKPINDKLKTFDDQNLSIRLRIFYCIKKKLLICHIYHIKLFKSYKASDIL
ncbi:hypothetical protein A3Q56_02422 [Intoshia linei]|uniref:Extended synaptotagmin-2 n=1 Tax=Intoshia linei TaxID=1819745 RepID=A0A177B6A1_9BILA|nr:hypothetical protein A3Q56_02422 [Intoshia linei]